MIFVSLVLDIDVLHSVMEAVNQSGDCLLSLIGVPVPVS